MQPLMRCNVQTRKLETLAIDILELQLTLPWRSSPKSGSRVSVLTSGVRAKLRYGTAGSAGPRCILADRSRSAMSGVQLLKGLRCCHFHFCTSCLRGVRRR